jgi:hypothetical protein
LTRWARGDRGASAPATWIGADAHAPRSYLSHFKTYLGNLKKLQSDNKAGKDDLLGTDDSKTGGLFSAKRTSQNINRLFMLGASRRHSARSPRAD